MVMMRLFSKKEEQKAIFSSLFWPLLLQAKTGQFAWIDEKNVEMKGKKKGGKEMLSQV